MKSTHPSALKGQYQASIVGWKHETHAGVIVALSPLRTPGNDDENDEVSNTYHHSVSQLPCGAMYRV